MFGWLRKFGDRVGYQTPPPEPAVVSRLEELAGVDIRLSELAGIPRHLRTALHAEEIERLLERRTRLVRPSVPVVPGRSS